MNHSFTVPYSELRIPPRGSFPQKIVHSPILQTHLSFQGNPLGFLFSSVVDSGADHCIFPAEFGEKIGLNIQSGNHIPSRGLGGGDVVYFHRVTIQIILEKQSWEFTSDVGFSRKMNQLGVGFLGRKGFFELFDEVTFYENQRKFKLIEY